MSDFKMKQASEMKELANKQNAIIDSSLKWIIEKIEESAKTGRYTLSFEDKNDIGNEIARRLMIAGYQVCIIPDGSFIVGWG